MPGRLLGLSAFALCLRLATPAAADPCHAIPDRGPFPNYLHAGKQFAGPVVYVGDGDSLCVDVGELRGISANSRDGEATKIVPFPAGSTWVEVRLADFYAPELGEVGGPEAKATLVRIAKGRAVSCIADHRSYDRVVAVCRLGGVSLGDGMRAAGVVEGGRGR